MRSGWGTQTASGRYPRQQKILQTVFFSAEKKKKKKKKKKIGDVRRTEGSLFVRSGWGTQTASGRHPRQQKILQTVFFSAVSGFSELPALLLPPPAAASAVTLPPFFFGDLSAITMAQ